MALGTQLVVTSMARWPPRVARSYPPFVTNETCQIKRREKVNICRNAKHIYSSYLVALWMRVFKGGLRICQVACDKK